MRPSCEGVTRNYDTSDATDEAWAGARGDPTGPADTRFAESGGTLRGLGSAPAPLREVWTSGPCDVWITGDDDILHHWTGGEWVLLPVPGDAGLLLGPPRGTPSGLWVLRRHAEGSNVEHNENIAFRITWL